MGRLLEKEFGLFLIPLADRLIGRDAPDAAVSAIKVVSDEPAAQVVFHLLRVLITVCFGGVLLDQAVGSFDHPVGFGGVRLGLAVFDFLLPTELLKGDVAPEKYARIERGFSELKGEETHEEKVQRGANYWHPQAARERDEDGGYLPGTQYQRQHVLSLEEQIWRDECQ